MDYVRDPYTIKCCPFKDNDTEVDMVWRPASPDAETFPAPHKFTSLFQGYFNWVDGEHVGEVFKPSAYHGGLRAVNRWFNNREALGYDVGLTPCEPLEDFSTGEAFDPDREPVKYNEDGFPRCCLDRPIPRFGVLWGMRSEVFEPEPPLPATECIWPPPLANDVWHTFRIPSGYFGRAYHGFEGGGSGAGVNRRIEFQFLTGDRFVVQKAFMEWAQCFAFIATYYSAVDDLDTDFTIFTGTGGSLAQWWMDIFGAPNEITYRVRHSLFV